MHLKKSWVMVFLMLLVFFVAGSTAWADKDKSIFLFDISAQDVTEALKKVATQAGYQLLFSVDQVDVLKSRPLSGRYSIEEALSLLLQDTGLSYEITTRGVIVIKKYSPTEVREGIAMKKKNRLISGAISSLLGMGVAQGAVDEAKEVEGRQMRVLEEVVVTAQRREQSLQDVPISVAALTMEQLDNLGIRNVTDLGEGAVPNLRIAPVGGNTRAYNIAIRGMEPSAVEQISREGTAGIYVDGVYLGRAQGLSMDQLDLERLEVLRGPQGTLFGRNTLGGAINMTSRKPTGEFGLEQRLGFGNLGYFNSITRVNLPEMAGLSIKFDYMHTERDGWVKNPGRRENDWNEQDRRGGRLSALWRPTDTVIVEYAYDRSTNRDTPSYQQIGKVFEGAPPFPEGSFQRVESGRVSRGRTAALNMAMKAKVEGHALTATWDINDRLTLKSITAYREMSQFHASNAAGSFSRPSVGSPFGRVSLTDVDQEQFSQELQLQGSADSIEYIVGYYYFKEEAEDASADAFANLLTTDGPIVLPELLFTRPAPARSHKVESRSQALFGQFVWTPPVLDERFHLTLGGRYNQDRKRGGRLLVNGAPAPMAFSYSENRFDPSVTLSWDWSETVNSYVRWSTAFRGGGVNTRSDIFMVYDADDVESWELGLKSELWDRRLRINAALFYTEWNDRQLDLLAPTERAPTNSVTVNTPEMVKLQGLEMDVAWIPLPGLTLGLGYGYLDVDEPAVTNPFTGAISQARAASAPRNTGTISVVYDFEPFSFGQLQVFVGSKYTSKFHMAGGGQLAGYNLWDARLTLSELRVGHGEFSIALWGKNLTDKEYLVGVNTSLRGASLLNAEIVTYGTPRTFGLDVTYRY